MKTTSLTVMGILLLTLSTTQAALVELGDYTGTITYSGGGITGIAGSPWLNDDTSLSWEVTDNVGSWTYKYTLVVGDNPDISHFIIQVSDNFTANDYLDGPGIEGPETFGDEGGSNPGIPETFYSIKFSPSGEDTEYEVEFTSTRGPTWGDFYAKGGNTGGIWNLGFTSPDSDLASQIGGDGEWDHIVVPDTVTKPPTQTIPAPAAVLLGALGTCTVTWLRRRRTV